MEQITAILIGAGGRGRTYARYSADNKESLKMVGVAEPNEGLRNDFADKYGISADNCFITWEDVFKRDRFADVVMICTQDRMHYAPAMEAIGKGYGILLEKPISPVPEECAALADAAGEKGVKFVVCHVLRYTPFFLAIKKIIENGEIGDIVSVVHNENVGNIHHSHSFVRGNWGKTEESAPMILAKSCHDTDIIQWLTGKKCLRVSSFGSLKYFSEKNCPEGAPPRCMDGCPYSDECPYFVGRLYSPGDPLYSEWFRAAATGCASPTDEQVNDALRTGPYGRCVFRCDNNVVDHQIVNMEFEGGITAAFSMCSFTPEISRSIKIMGTKGQIRGHMEKGCITVTAFRDMKERSVNIEYTDVASGHGGGDHGLMQAFCKYIRGEYAGSGISDVRVSAASHMIAFAAEESRLGGGKVVEL